MKLDLSSINRVLRKVGLVLVVGVDCDEHKEPTWLALMRVKAYEAQFR